MKLKVGPTWLETEEKEEKECYHPKMGQRPTIPKTTEAQKRFHNVGVESFFCF